MPSFSEVCTQAPVVVLDAASALVQVGVLCGEGPGRWASSPDESGVAVFTCLEQLAVDPRQVPVWIFCDGPGSLLGIRTVAMALRTWSVLQPRPVFAYCSLALVAHAADRDDLGVIADARRDTWHLFDRRAGLRRVATSELAGPLVMPENFRHWSVPPPGASPAPYLLADLIPKVWSTPDLLQPAASPDAFLHEEPSYVTWTPQIHRAPGS